MYQNFNQMSIGMMKKFILSLLAISCLSFVFGCSYQQRLAWYWKRNPHVVRNNQRYINEYYFYEEKTVTWKDCMPVRYKHNEFECLRVYDINEDNSVDMLDYSIAQNNSGLISERRYRNN